MPYSLNDADWIETDDAAKLRTAGIKTTTALLDAGATVKGRRVLSELTGLEEKKILAWTNTSDRLRIKGIGSPYANLLHHAGVDTVRELKYRNPANLARAMADANAKRKLVRTLPSVKVISRWIEFAKKLPVKISY
jgi:predicted flap endonuclease-1-like 5' DNA nuclease